MSDVDFKKHLEDIAVAFRENVELEDRRFRLKTFKGCFVGLEAVDYLVKSGAAPSRQDAVELGNALMASYVFEHVTRDHAFADEFLFCTLFLYCFI